MDMVMEVRRQFNEIPALKAALDVMKKNDGKAESDWSQNSSSRQHKNHEPRETSAAAAVPPRDGASAECFRRRTAPCRAQTASEAIARRSPPRSRPPRRPPHEAALFAPSPPARRPPSYRRWWWLPRVAGHVAGRRPSTRMGRQGNLEGGRRFRAHQRSSQRCRRALSK